MKNTATITAPAARITRPECATPPTIASQQRHRGGEHEDDREHDPEAAGMVTRTKQGNRTIYAIGDPALFELCDQVCGSLRRQIAELDAMLS